MSPNINIMVPHGFQRSSGLLRLTCLALSLALVVTGCGLSGENEDTTPPPAPSELSASSEDPETSTVQWSAPDASDVDGYRIYRSDDTPIEVETNAPINPDGLVSGTSFTDQGVSNGTTYRYRVTAVDESDNESTPSDSARVTPFADPPSRP
jgi:fibronectin type 3 domain-containing protein